MLQPHFGTVSVWLSKQELFEISFPHHCRICQERQGDIMCYGLIGGNTAVEKY